MKNKISKIVSSILILAFLVSCFSVFAFAADEEVTETPEDIKKEVTLLINRTFDEGWDYQNGFSTAVKTHSFGVEYEETKDFLYNYYTRILANSTTDGYIELRYGTNGAANGASMLELDIKTDDYNSLGTIAYLRSPGGSAGSVFNLMSIQDNNLYLISPGSKEKANTVDYMVGSLSGDWVHVAFAYTVNQRRCPSCGSVVDITAEMKDADIVCCKDGEVEGDGLGSGVKVSQMDKLMSIRVYFGYTETFDVEGAVNAASMGKLDKDLNSTYYYDVTLEGITGIDIHRIGLPTGNANLGQSYCIDNVKLYNGSSVPVDFDPEVDGYGKNVNTAMAKTIQILSASASKTTLQYIQSGLVMKVGTDYCLNKNVKSPIMQTEGNIAYGAPVKIDGQVFVPLQSILNWIGYPMYQHDDNLSFDISTENGSTFVTIGRNTATVNGAIVELNAAPGMATDDKTGEQYIVIALSDVENLFDGYHVTYDEMGLIIIAEEAELLNRASDLDIMLDLMKSFIFDTKTGDNFYESVKNNTANFDHPYILANDAKFAELKAAYAAVEGDENYDASIKAYLETVMVNANTVYGKYATADPAAEGKYLAADITNPYAEDENNGYDALGGRLDAAAEFNSEIRLLALAYQITGDVKYAHLAYEFAVSMGKWEHWGPAYFVNCADAVSAYAMAYDWLYDIWAELGYNLAAIEEVIYSKGIYQGYRASNGLECQFLSNQGDFSVYHNDATSKNAVSTSGMVIASLAILGVDYLTEIENRYDEVYVDYTTTAKWMIENNLASLIKYGLDSYAPDGSYLESPSYWAYATNAFALMTWAIESASGSDMGLMNTWGMDKTFYYAIQTEVTVTPTEQDPTGYLFWNYHESDRGYQNTELFFYAAHALSDQGLAAVRVQQLAKKPVSIWDVLSYNKDFVTAELPALALDYKLEGLEGFVSRSDWADGYIFVGMMGNDNDTYHGQVDSGNFVYSSQGYNWFCDLGAENKNVYGSLDAGYRYGYYANSADGANVIFINSDNSMKYGQLLDAGGTLSQFVSKDEGMYAVIDNGEVYGGNVNYAYRGVLFTNDRSTVVIQDDIAFTNVYTAIWVAHTTAEYLNVSEDGRTAYLRQKIGDEYLWLRATLVTDTTTMKFTTSDAYGFMLSSTYKQTFSTLLGYEAENDRSVYKKLMIEHEDALSFEAAVVIEVVPDDFGELPVQYDYVKLTKWTEDLIKSEYDSNEEDEIVLKNPDINDIKTYGEIAKKYIDNGYAFSTRIKDFYIAMVYAANAVRVFEPSGMIEEIKEIYQAYLNYQIYIVQYNMFRDEINGSIKGGNTMAKYLCGYNN